jgi:hypothetical protein
MVKNRNAHRILVGKAERKRLFEGCKQRWADNMTMDLKKTG